jgi:glutamate racemase
MKQTGPIGIFDSGYGGLTVLREIVNQLPEYDFIYLGDNARAPYGTRSFEVVYEFTLQNVKKLFSLDCPLIILACNTASAKALRTIQQKDLPMIDPSKRVLGVIRPTAEIVGNYSKTGSIGILGTPGTVASLSYLMEIQKFFPNVNVYQEACPLWVPLIENNEYSGPGADYFVKKNIDHLIQKGFDIDTLILGCTHYPLLLEKIKKYTPAQIQIISQGEIVAASLKEYLNRHPEMDEKCSKNNTRKFYTTDTPELFDKQAATFYGTEVRSEHISIQ